jgi:biotin transport system substrate-specific component
MSLYKHFTGTNIALVAVFAGFIGASTIWGGVPLGSGVPITLQTFAVLLAGAALGAWRGAAAVTLYLIVGTAGAPIFAQHKGGVAVWATPTAGFLVSFVVAAFVVGWIVERLRSRGQLTTAGIVGACAVGSLVVINVIGWTYVALRVGLDAPTTVGAATPFLPGDIIKLFLAAVVAATIHRAYPGLLGSVRVSDKSVEPVDAKAIANA